MKILPDGERIRWYMHRLRSMEPAEVGYRLSQAWRRHRERAWLEEPPRVDVTPALATYRQGKGARLVTMAPAEYPAAFASNRQATLRQADGICQGRVRLFRETVQVGQPVDWHRDPQQGGHWPCRFYGEIDIRDGRRVGGVKWVWELNRHHQLVVLAKAYWLSGDDRYAVEAVGQLASWLEANPPYVGVNWTSPLELAIRLINWCWILDFLREAPALGDNMLSSLLGSICHQARHIEAHLSAYSSANNHLMGEAAGLAVVGMVFEGLEESGRWRDKGLALLEQEIPRQIYEDGVPAEQAIAYLAFVLEFNLLAWTVAARQGRGAPTVWLERLRAAAQFIRHVMDEAGHLPALGDSDEGRVVPLDDSPDAHRYRSLLASSAVLCQEPDFKAAAGAWEERSHWLLGAEGQRRFQALKMGSSEPGSRLFPEGGYGVMRAPGRVIMLDHGPLGYLSLAAHGHADALSLTLSLHGTPILVDPGTFAYQEGFHWRDYFRATAAHNTVTVDQRSQSQMLGPFLWGRRAETSLQLWRSTSEYDLWQAEHDGYASLGVMHRRTVLYRRPDQILLQDTLEGSGTHHLCQSWHLPPEAQISTLETGAVQIRAGGVACALRLMEPEAATMKAGTGWTAPYYGKKLSAPVLSVHGAFALPVRLVTIFNLEGGEVDWRALEQHLKTLLATLLRE